MDWTIGFAIGAIFGVIAGILGEWKDHRQFCDCKQCKRWRERMAAKALRKTE